jgi:hypothetical protein
MIAPVSEWDPFDLLSERDSTRGANPDLALAAAEPGLPVIGVVLVEPYAPEFPDRDRQGAARRAVESLLASVPAARVRIDTRLDVNRTQLRTPGEVESMIARMDAIVTTRLRGLVLALKNSVPALAVDPVAGWVQDQASGRGARLARDQAGRPAGPGRSASHARVLPWRGGPATRPPLRRAGSHPAREPARRIRRSPERRPRVGGV